MGGAQATQTMMKSMASATTAMQAVSVTMDPAQMQRDMMQFERQTAQLEMAQETMEDAIDSALGAESDEEEADAVVDAVFEELQIDMFSGVSAAPTGVAAAAVAEPEPQAS